MYIDCSRSIYRPKTPIEVPLVVSLVVEQMQENGKTATERGENFSTQHHDGRHMG